MNRSSLSKFRKISARLSWIEVGWNAVIFIQNIASLLRHYRPDRAIAIDASPLVVAMFLSLTALVAGVWMAYLHSRFLMAVTPVVISVLMATLAMKMFEPRLFVSASEKGWFPLSLFVSIPFYFYLSYLLEIEEKRRTFRANVIGFLRGVSEEIRRSTREHRDQGEIRHGGTELGSIDELQRGEAKEPEVISSTSDQKEQGTPKRDKRKIILD